MVVTESLKKLNALHFIFHNIWGNWFSILRKILTLVYVNTKDKYAYTVQHKTNESKQPAWLSALLNCTGSIIKSFRNSTTRTRVNMRTVLVRLIYCNKIYTKILPCAGGGFPGFSACNMAPNQYRPSEQHCWRGNAVEGGFGGLPRAVALLVMPEPGPGAAWDSLPVPPPACLLLQPGNPSSCSKPGMDMHRAAARVVWYHYTNLAWRGAGAVEAATWA
jgi:hypothetical protein